VSKANPVLQVAVWRGAQQGEFVSYEVPLRENQTVLDVVTFIQRHLDATLSYRFSCRVGMCGSCAMTVNGVPRWTCRTHVSRVARGKRLQIAPLRNMQVIKDLSVDMSDFFDKWARARGSFTAGPAPAEFALIPPDSRERRAAEAGIECIGCGVCYAACDLVSANKDYLGPAALNRAWTLVNDVRDVSRRERLAAVAGDAGCHACHSQQSCVQWCPKELNPTASIGGLKRATALAALKGEL
jgi:succinate dehydrogenase iron-sulfur subunit